MTALGLSQSELARRVGIRQPSLHALLHTNKRGSAHLHKIARELGTTPAYLAGETDDPGAELPDEPLLDSETRDLLKNFDRLQPGDRRALLQIAKSMAKRPAGSSKVHDNQRDDRETPRGRHSGQGRGPRPARPARGR